MRAVYTARNDRQVSYPRRNQHRHALQALRHAAAAVPLVLLALSLACVGMAQAGEAAARGRSLPDGVALLLLAVIVGWASSQRIRAARRQLDLTRRNRIGADSEDAVAAALRPLCREGWVMRRSLDWSGTGDIDLALLPPGHEIAFAVEVKTRSYASQHLQRVCDQATWLAGRWGATSGGVAVLALAHQRQVYRRQQNVLVVSLDLLAETLRMLADKTHTKHRPARTWVRASPRLPIAPRAAEPARPVAAPAEDRHRADRSPVSLLAEHLARSPARSDEILSQQLACLDRGAWHAACWGSVSGHAVFLLLGPTGVFLLRASNGDWTVRQIDLLAEVASRIEREMSGYRDPVRVMIVPIGELQEPRVWFTASGASAWVTSSLWLAWQLEHFEDRGVEARHLVRLREMIGRCEPTLSRHTLLPRGVG